MQTLHPHDISLDAQAAIYTLPMTVLPTSLQMDAYETLQCIGFQCVGFIHDATGVDWPTPPIDPSADYRFVGAYFDPFVTISRYPSAAGDAQTVLHEFAHYLDMLAWTPFPNQPHSASIDTLGFAQISFVISNPYSTVNPCAARRSDDPMDFVSRYGFLQNAGCDAGQYRAVEEFAEAFSFYVVAGRHFRSAAAKRTMIATKYDWRKQHVFGGIEYDTANQVESNSGCNDAPGLESQQPGHFSCSEDAVWDWTLPRLNP